MLINARDLRQWTYLRNLRKKKKKKTHGINQCVEKGGGGGITYPLEKGGKKKTMVLTLGSPPEKGQRKKTSM